MKIHMIKKRHTRKVDDRIRVRYQTNCGYCSIHSVFVTDERDLVTCSRCLKSKEVLPEGWVRK